MENVSAVTSVILTAYTELEDNRYLFFVFFLLLYVVILLCNSLLILAICTERGLHGPMYLFICSLAVNGVYGSSSLFPSLLALLLAHDYEISLTFCLLQKYFIYSYGTVEFTILAAMSYDRYAAICHPLHYHLLMSPRKAYAAIVLSWVIPCVYIALCLIWFVRLSFCGQIIEGLYCAGFTLVKLACSDTTNQSIFVLISLLFSPCSQIVMILFSYVQILRICLFASKESQTKAIQTCVPHLVTVMIYSFGLLFQFIHNSPQFNKGNVSHKARMFMSLYFLIIPPLCNPVVYGMSIQAIRVPIFRFFIA